MAYMKTCQWCGRRFDDATAGQRSNSGYCSEKCVVAARAAGKKVGRATPFQEALLHNAAKGSSSNADMGRSMKFIIPIIGILIIIGLIGVAVNGIQNAFSDTKIKIVSASCETQEEFVSLLKEALSGVSATVIEGDEFTTYSRQARDAVKEREGKYSTFKDSVYFVRLPDSVNVYVWFESEDQATAYVYKTK
ncbi:MAG: hypothetical protein LBG57_14740 [Treponema sp.]|nr:hypothetical protein [Treponema sp.]